MSLDSVFGFVNFLLDLLQCLHSAHNLLLCQIVAFSAFLSLFCYEHIQSLSHTLANVRWGQKFNWKTTSVNKWVTWPTRVPHPLQISSVFLSVQAEYLFRVLSFFVCLYRYGPVFFALFVFVFLLNWKSQLAKFVLSRFQLPSWQFLCRSLIHPKNNRVKSLADLWKKRCSRSICTHFAA